jgi:hypothetical protein
MKPFIKEFLRKGKKLANFGSKRLMKVILGFYKKENIMDKENFKQNNRYIKVNFKMEKSMDLDKNFTLKLE